MSEPNEKEPVRMRTAWGEDITCKIIAEDSETVTYEVQGGPHDGDVFTCSQ